MPAPGGRRPKDPKGRSGKGKGDGGMFFGASPTERENLRETKDPKKLKLSDLNLDAAIDRDSLNAPEKVGEELRLIDMAMGVDAFIPDKKTKGKKARATKQTSEERARGGASGRPAGRPGAPRGAAPRGGAPRPKAARPGAPRGAAPRGAAPRSSAARPGAARPSSARPGAPRPGAPRPGAPRPAAGKSRPAGPARPGQGKPRPGTGPKRPGGRPKGPRKPR